MRLEQTYLQLAEAEEPPADQAAAFAVEGKAESTAYRAS